MKKPHVLLVSEKWMDGTPGKSLSNVHHNISGSLECSELATYSNFFYEDHPQHLDDALLTYHRRVNPDLTFIVMLPMVGFTNPTAKSLATIASKTPIVFIWWDSVHKSIFNIIESLNQYATLNVIVDNPFFLPKEKYLALWTPQDPRIYKDLYLQRDIDVSFVGTMNCYPDREKYLNHLISNCGHSIYQGGGQRVTNLSVEDYANKMQRSKISLNFSRTVNGLNQTKGRLWEITLCGAMLMEDINQGTSLWFEPFKDYVPFTSPDDLVDKTNYYLNHHDKLTEIASSGKMKSSMQYSPKNWWSIIFDKCGIPITR